MEPTNGSGRGNKEDNGDQKTYDKDINANNRHVQAMGRGGGIHAGRVETEDTLTERVEEMTTNDNETTMGDETKRDSDAEMDAGLAVKVQGNNRVIMGNEASRKAAAEYKSIVESIMTWEMVVEKHEENLKNATNDEDRNRYRQTIASSKQLLSQFRREENDHFLSGSYKNHEVLLWDESDREDENEDEPVEIVGVVQGSHATKLSNMQDMEFETEGFSEDDDAEMADKDVSWQSGKRKEREDASDDVKLPSEEMGTWKVVTNRKKSQAKTKTSNIKGSGNDRDAVEQRTNKSDNQHVDKHKGDIETKQNSSISIPNTISKSQISSMNKNAEHNKRTSLIKKEILNKNKGNKTVLITEEHRDKDKVAKSTTNEEISRQNTKNKSAVNEGNSKGPLDIHQKGIETRSSLQRTITSYASATKMKRNANQIRFNFSFNVRVNSPSEWRRVATILLEQSNEIDTKSFILPWDESKVDSDQGLTLEMVSNRLTMRDSVITKFFNAKGNMIPGKIYYQAGVRFSTELEPRAFLDKWNSNKRDRKERDLEVLNIALAIMQNSPESYLIGIAVGSSEDQDTTILNRELAAYTKIAGIEVSYQNFYQAGITNEFWDIANKKAKATGVNEASREYLKCKYSWAPSALAIFVPRIQMVARARKIMIKKFGKLIDGVNPMWPDGTRMRFLPIKGGMLKSDKTKAIIKKRIAYHIWIKAHEKIIPTNMVNIHEGGDIFDGKSFSQLILGMDSNHIENMSLFRHFKRRWSMGTDKEVRWDLSVHKDLYEEAMATLQRLKQELVTKYGNQVNQFFVDQPERSIYGQSQREPMGDDDEENWFDDDDSIPEKAVIEQGFEQFIDDDQSEVSWGTNLTKYTEMVQSTTQSTNTSSLTHEVYQVDDDERERRISAVEHYLVTKYNMDRDSVSKVRNKEAPYRIVIQAMKEKIWEIDEVLEGIYAIFQAQKVKKAPDPNVNTDNHDDESL